MSSEVWYRKWRPQTFAEVVGQKHVTQTLARAVVNDRIAHAYLFCGPRGTGKTSTARILAKAVNCEANEDGQPCTRCDSCVAVTQGRALDLIEMDAASNRGIDDIRGLRDKVGYSPNSSRYKVYLIDEAHELTAFAFDALLKTLEEPPPHVIFVLATTEAHRLPETILSRCQRFDFQRIKLSDVVSRLEQIAGYEGVEATRETLEIIARRATGSLRDALNQFEQLVAAQGHHLTEENVRIDHRMSGDQRASTLVELMLERRLADVLNLVAQVRDDGADLRQFTGSAVQYLRSVLLVRAGADASLALSDEAIVVLKRIAEAAPIIEVLRAARALTGVDFRADPQSPLPLELALIEFIEAPSSVAASTEQQPAQPVHPEARPQPALVRPASPAVNGAADRVRSALAPRNAPPAPLRSRFVAAAEERHPVENVPAPASSAPTAGPPVIAAAFLPPSPADGPSSTAVQTAAGQGGAEAQAGLDSTETSVALSRAEAATATRVSAADGETIVLAKVKSPAQDAELLPLVEAEIIPAKVAPVDAPAAQDRAVPDEVPTLELAQRRFRELYERCADLDKSAARLLNSGGCDIVEFTETTITIGFKHPRMVHLATGSSIDAALRRGIADTFGASYGVSYLHAPDVPSRLQLLDAERPSHLLEEALKLGAKRVGQS